MLAFLVFILSISLVYTNNGIHLTVTDCQTVELEYHLTMFTVQLDKPVNETTKLTFRSEHPNIALPLENNTIWESGFGRIPRVVYVYGKDVGSTYIHVVSNSSQVVQNKKHNEVKVNVVHSLTVKSINVVIGWIYFLAWSVSFYPQVIENFRRKSVVGLNFDFLCYNFTGFLAYTFFNVGLFYIPKLQDEYFDKYGGSVIPVEPNDVFFSIHAFVITIVTISQCFFFERGDQRVSKVCMLLLVVGYAFALFALIPAGLGKVNWLTYLYCFSYIKLAVTLIKYIPQAYMNFKRKSTVGWSIGNVLLDFTGGSLSIVQMILLAYNNNQWSSIFGDLTKFGLGLFSVLFDILFMTQHYVLYRNRRPGHEAIPDGDTVNDSSQQDPLVT